MSEEKPLKKTTGCPKDRLLIGTGTLSRGKNYEIDYGTYKVIEGPLTKEFVGCKATWHKAYRVDGKIVKREEIDKNKGGIEKD